MLRGRVVWNPLLKDLVSLVQQGQSVVMQAVDGLCGLIPEAGGPIATTITSAVSTVASFIIGELTSNSVKGLLDAVPQQQVDIREGENREPPYVTEVNTRGQCPALRLPGGDVLCEILAICEYIEELAPCAPSPAPRILSPTDTQALSVCPVVGAGLRR